MSNENHGDVYDFTDSEGSESPSQKPSDVTPIKEETHQKKRKTFKFNKKMNKMQSETKRRRKSKYSLVHN